MKKLLAILAALLLCLGCCAAFAQTGLEEYTGYWKLETITLLGYEMTADEFDRVGFTSIHEDGMVVLSIAEGEFFTTTMHNRNGVCVLESAQGDMPVTIGENGWLRFDLTSEGMTMTLAFSRSTAPEIDPAIAPFVGEWKLEYATLGSMSLSADTLGEYVAHVYEDGYGVILADGDRISFQVEVQDGVVCWIDNEGTVDPIYMNEQGQACFDMTSDDTTITMVMNRVGAAATPAVTEPAVAAPAENAVSFDGVWTPVSYSIFGMELEADSVDMEVRVTINGDQAELYMDGDSTYCGITVDGRKAVMADSADSIPCELKEDGYLYLELESDGLTMTMKMQREGGAPAASQPASSMPAQAGTEYDGNWNAVKVEAMGQTFQMKDLGLGAIRVEISGDTARLVFGDEDATCTVTYGAQGVVINDGYTDMPGVLNEAGTLVLELESDGVVMHLHMEREDGAAQPAASAAPAATMLECSICGAEHAETESTTFGSMILCPECSDRFFN